MAFYDNVSAIWLEMMGQGWVLAEKIARKLQDNDLVRPGESVLDVGCGKDAFPIRGRLWRRLMDASLPWTGSHLSCAFNYLLTCGRFPNLLHLSWPIDVNLSMDTITDFYRSYFAIFGIDHQAVDEAIRIEMAEYLPDGRYQSFGEMELALIWWQQERFV